MKKENESKRKSTEGSIRDCTYWAYDDGGPNGVHVKIVWLVVLFNTMGTTSDIIAAGVAHTIASTHMNIAVITVNGFVWN